MALKSLKSSPIIDSVQKTAKDFNRELGKLAEFCTDNYELVVRKTVIDLFSSIVELTPIDTGRARANWAMSTTLDSVDYVDLSDVADWEWNLEDGTTIWIYNNLVYIVPLEEGHSDQAPRGMVAVSLANFSRFLRDAVNKLTTVIKKD